MSYGPFEVVSVEENDCIFSLDVCERTEAEGASLVYSNKSEVEEGFVVMEVYSTPDGHYFELTQPGSPQINARLSVTADFRKAVLSLAGRPVEQWLAFNTSVDFCFLLSTAGRNTLLTHASSVIYEGKAYLFLGKSGTGKSTHSRMWLEGIEGAELMNDDHPIIRIGEDGIPVAYGSPWSGKTHCYRNIAAPVGAIVRIRQEKENVIRRLRPIEAYGSVMASCSGFPIEERFTEGKSNTLQKIIKGAPCWELGCLPNVDAAVVCRGAVCE